MKARHPGPLNGTSLNLALTFEDQEQIREGLSSIPITGERYQPAMMKLVTC